MPHVGQIHGRGKLDRYKRYDKPIKEIYLYPLTKDFKRVLAGEQMASPNRYAFQAAKVGLPERYGMRQIFGANHLTCCIAFRYLMK